MDFIKELNDKTELVNSYLDDLMNFEPVKQQTVMEAMRYSVCQGGKRIRPVLALACAEAAGGNPDMALPFAAALELIHTYSLIHDDLPGMDNDELRRGKPTSHMVFGEGMAILAGDALLNYAFETSLNAASDDKTKLLILQNLSKASGIFGMIGGQVVDLESENKKIDINTLKYMYSLKTGALIKTACAIGAICAGVNENAFDTYSENLGYAFQIRDDILDFTSTKEELGKPIGSDERNNKSTFVTVYGIENAEKELELVTKNAINALELFGNKARFLEELAKYLCLRKR